MQTYESDDVSANSYLANYSLEMTAKDTESLREARDFIPKKTAISVTYLPGEEMPARLAAAALVKALGFVPVPHISARRLLSRNDLTTFLERLKNEVGVERAFVVAGDPPRPLGPFEDALAVIQSGELAKSGIKTVGISGYPEGHPDISQEKLWAALRDKCRTLIDCDHEVEIMTQFAFDHAPTLRWLERVRQETGFTGTVRLGIPGPASVKTLLRFASRCGVSATAGVMAKYGVSITQIFNTAGPVALIDEFTERLQPSVHGDVKFHFYPFGGLRKTVEWVHCYASASAVGA
jgi:methylenetetrahydrofolate reductase (NADH)